MSKEEIKEGMDNVAGGMDLQPEKKIKPRSPIRYGAPFIRIPSEPREQPEQSVEPLIPANPMEQEKRK